MTVFVLEENGGADDVGGGVARLLGDAAAEVGLAFMVGEMLGAGETLGVGTDPVAGTDTASDGAVVEGDAGGPAGLPDPLGLHAAAPNESAKHPAARWVRETRRRPPGDSRAASGSSTGSA